MYFNLVSNETGLKVENLLNRKSIKQLMIDFIEKENEHNLIPFLTYNNKVLKTVFAMYGFYVRKSVYLDI